MFCSLCTVNEYSSKKFDIIKIKNNSLLFTSHHSLKNTFEHKMCFKTTLPILDCTLSVFLRHVWKEKKFNTLCTT